MQRTKSIISGLQFLALASEMAESDRSGKRSESSAADFGGVEEKWFNFEPETNLCAVTVCKLLKEERGSLRSLCLMCVIIMRLNVSMIVDTIDM